MVATTKSFRKWRQCFADQALADVGAIAVGCIDKINAKLDGAFQDAPSFFGIFGLAPDSRPCQAHGSETQTIYFKVITDCERFVKYDHGCIYDDPFGVPGAENLIMSVRATYETQADPRV